MPKQPKVVTTDEIVEFFGGPTKLAELLKCTPQNISTWRQYLPRKQAFNVLILAKGKWTLEQMPVRPIQPHLIADRVTSAA